VIKQARKKSIKFNAIRVAFRKRVYQKLCLSKFPSKMRLQIEPNSVAERCGRLYVGDQILQVDYLLL
jgi:pyoverdine/dityrosine biosynthesis protein Dit1